MVDATLNIGDASAGVALVPGAVERFRGGPNLHDEVAGQVVRFGLPTLLAPKAEQGRLVAAHDNPGVRAADKSSAVRPEGLDRIAHDLLLALASLRRAC